MQIFNSSRIRRNGTRAGSLPRELHGLQVLLTRARAGLNRPAGGSVVAFTSANSGEGVSFVARSFAEKIALQTGKRTVVVDAGRLRKLCITDVINLPGQSVKSAAPNLWLLPEEIPRNGSGQPQVPERSWQTDSERSLECVQALSATFDYTLIDCPSLSASFEAELLAPEVDGVVMVVEADRTKRDHILRARRTIEMANGKVLALVLNKRRHVVPEWLYHRL